MRTPDDILNDLDSFAGTQQELVQLHGLVWEVIEDLLDSLKGYSAGDWSFSTRNDPAHVVDECHRMLTDYVTNHYGDD